MFDLAGEFGGVAEEIFKRDAEELGVGFDAEAGLDGDVEFTVWVFFLNVGGNVFCEGGEIDRLGCYVGAGDAGELEECVYETAHALHPGADALDIVAADLVDCIRVVLFEGEREAIDGAERSAQIVRDGVGEGFQFPVGVFELGGALPDAFFEGDVELVNHISVYLDLSPGDSECGGGGFGLETHSAFAIEVAEHEDDEDEVKASGEQQRETATSSTDEDNLVANGKKSAFFGFGVVGEVPEVIHLGLAGAADNEGVHVVYLASAAELDSLPEQREAFFKDGPEFYNAFALRGIIDGEALKVVQFAGERTEGLIVWLEVRIVVGDEETAAAGLGVLG